jgi:undecaprenyl-diphosphatase
MNVLDAIIYGIVQGVSEFLPVSSSGHLALLPKVLDIADPGVSFDLIMHVGTGLAILVYFHKDVLNLILQYTSLLKSPFRFKQLSPFAFNFFITTLTSIVFILILMVPAKQFGRSPSFIAFNLCLFGLLMYFADRFSKVKESFSLHEKSDLKSAILLGVAQSIAIFPGVSRSGITLTMGRALSLSRKRIGEYSFLMSLPIIFAGALKDLVSMLRDQNLSFELTIMATGVLTAFFVGLMTIHFFLKFLVRFGLTAFMIYRILLAAIVFIGFH